MRKWRKGREWEREQARNLKGRGRSEQVEKGTREGGRGGRECEMEGSKSLNRKKIGYKICTNLRQTNDLSLPALHDKAQQAPHALRQRGMCSTTCRHIGSCV